MGVRYCHNIEVNPTNLTLSDIYRLENLLNDWKQQTQLKSTLMEIDERMTEELANLEHASDMVIGMKIIQQFVIDLLGRNSRAAKIFLTKTESE